MTLRLISDNEQPDHISVPAMLRQYAKEIEAGEFGEVSTAVLIIEGGEVIDLGDELTDIELMGLFEAAKLQTFANMVTDDD